ncbi:MAG TPA: high-affinity nickel-transport family protein [Polyangiaceae bacterium]|nr:high-affinity nickel-transport family protein [Polyangiaceae bacterium]
MTPWAILGLGFMLGLRHATDADHVVAVSTIVSRSKTLRSAVLIGALWGLGHTLTILLVGGAIVVFHVVVPPGVDTVLELCVATMLIVLGGLNVFGALLQQHAAKHADHRAPAQPEARLSLRPLFVGIVHGLAGSAAIALLVLATIESVAGALLYLGLFGVGTIVGMALLTFLVVVPVAAASRRFVSLERYLAGFTGVASVAFGALLALRAVLGD